MTFAHGRILHYVQHMSLRIAAVFTIAWTLTGCSATLAVPNPAAVPVSLADACSDLRIASKSHPSGGEAITSANLKKNALVYGAIGESAGDSECRHDHQTLGHSQG